MSHMRDNLDGLVNGDPDWQDLDEEDLQELGHTHGMEITAKYVCYNPKTHNMAVLCFPNEGYGNWTVDCSGVNFAAHLQRLGDCGVDRAYVVTLEKVDQRRWGIVDYDTALRVLDRFDIVRPIQGSGGEFWPLTRDLKPILYRRRSSLSDESRALLSGRRVLSK